MREKRALLDMNKTVGWEAMVATAEWEVGMRHMVWGGQMMQAAQMHGRT